MKKLVISLLALSAAGVGQAQTIAGVHLNDESSAALRSIAGAGLTARKLSSSQPEFQSYLLWNPTTQSSGSMGICRGRVFAINMNLATEASAWEILREKVAEYGNPIVTFGSTPYSDGSNVEPWIKFRWPAHNYEMRIPTASRAAAAGDRPVQEINGGGRCR
jgi:hypothetical protein